MKLYQFLPEYYEFGYTFPVLYVPVLLSSVFSEVSDMIGNILVVYCKIDSRLIINNMEYL